MSNLYTKFKTKLFWRIWSNAPSVCFEPKNTKIITNLTIFGKIALFGIVFFALSFTTLSIMTIWFILALLIATFYPVFFAKLKITKEFESNYKEKLSERLEDDFINNLINESEFKKYYPKIRKKEKIIEQRKKVIWLQNNSKKEKLKILIKEIEEKMNNEEKE